MLKKSEWLSWFHARNRLSSKNITRIVKSTNTTPMVILKTGTIRTFQKYSSRFTIRMKQLLSRCLGINVEIYIYSSLSEAFLFAEDSIEISPSI